MGYFNYVRCPNCKMDRLHLLIAVERHKEGKRIWQTRCTVCQTPTNIYKGKDGFFQEYLDARNRRRQRGVKRRGPSGYYYSN